MSARAAKKDEEREDAEKIAVTLKLTKGLRKKLGQVALRRAKEKGVNLIDSSEVAREALDFYFEHHP